MSPKQAKSIALPDFYKLPFRLLSLNGIKVVYWDENDRMSWGEKFGLFMLLFNIATGFSFKINFLFNGIFETNLDYTAFTIYGIFVVNSLSKLVALIIGYTKLNFVLKNLYATYPKTSELIQYYEIEKHYKKIYRKNVFLTVFHIGTTAMFTSFPLLQSITDYMKNGEFPYRLPFMMEYPFDVKTPLRYSIAYFFQVCAGFNSSTLFLGSDLVLITSVRLINMNLEYLKKRIRDFKPSGTDQDIKELSEIAKFHDRTLTYVVQIDKMFNLSIFMNYFATGMVVCLVGYQIVAGTEFLDLVKFGTFICSTSEHIYLIASAGQEMTDLSLEIGDSFFHHSWYNAEVKYQRMLMMALMRAQQPVHLNAFKFFVISKESFKALLSTSYQFFALINTQLED